MENPGKSSGNNGEKAEIELRMEGIGKVEEEERESERRPWRKRKEVGENLLPLDVEKWKGCV